MHHAGWGFSLTPTEHSVWITSARSLHRSSPDMQTSFAPVPSGPGLFIWHPLSVRREWPVCEYLRFSRIWHQLSPGPRLAGAFHVNCCLAVIDSQGLCGLNFGRECRLLQEPTLAFGPWLSPSQLKSRLGLFVPRRWSKLPTDKANHEASPSEYSQNGGSSFDTGWTFGLNRRASARMFRRFDQPVTTKDTGAQSWSKIDS